MRTRMSGGVGRAISDGGPYPISLRFPDSLSHCRGTQVFTNRKLHSVDFRDESAG